MLQDTIVGAMWGSLLLIALYAVVQEGASRKLGTLGQVAETGLKRFLSPDVAGVGDHTKTVTGSGRKLTPNSTAPAPGPFYQL